MKKIHLLIALSLLNALPAISETVSITINISVAGTLFDSLSTEERSSVTHLTVNGNIDARDFKTMRDYMPKLEHISLLNAYIKDFYGNGGTSTSSYPEHYSENTLPQRAFFHQTEYQGLDTLILPSSITNIGQFACYNCSGLKSMTIPTGITYIEQFAFFNCKSLSSISFPSTLTSIGSYAFSSCSGLTSLSFSSSVTTIGPYAFIRCSGLTSLTLTSSITTIGSNAFAYCSGLTSVLISSSVMYIGDKAFSFCAALTSIKIPKSVISLGLSILYGCNGLDSIIVNDSNLYYASMDGVLFDKNLNSLLSYPIARSGAYSIPNTVARIEMNAFANCSNLTNIEIPSSVTSIEAYAFTSCSSLTSITIPEGISNISTQSFANCTGLNSIHIKSIVPPVVDADGLKNVSRTNCTVYVPKGMRTFYVDAPTWSEFTRIREEGDITTDNVEISDYNNRIYAQNGMLTIESHALDLPVAIYSTNGALVKTFRTHDLTTTISLPSGSYLVKMGNQTAKVAL